MKLKIIIFSLIAILSSLYILPVFAVSYTVPNGDFEAWTSGNPDDWISNWGLTEEITTASYVHGGTSAVKLTTSIDQTVMRASALIAVNPSSSYSAELWVIDNDADGVLHMGINYYRADLTTNSGQGSYVVTDNANYQLLSGGLTIPSDCVYVELVVYAWSVTGTFIVYVDDFTLDGPEFIPEVNAPFIVILSGFLIISSVLLYKKKQNISR